jgi:hypothetical protein
VIWLIVDAGSVPVLISPAANQACLHIAGPPPAQADISAQPGRIKVVEYEP